MGYLETESAKGVGNGWDLILFALICGLGAISPPRLLELEAPGLTRGQILI